MKTQMFRTRLLGTVAAALLVSAPVAGADVGARLDEPSYGSMILDAAVARPVGLGATVVGSVLWIVTLPFSALGGNIDEAARALVVKPARYTFTRPLGEL